MHSNVAEPILREAHLQAIPQLTGPDLKRWPVSVGAELSPIKGRMRHKNLAGRSSQRGHAEQLDPMGQASNASVPGDEQLA